jgi:hypothetical protein
MILEKTVGMVMKKWLSGWMFAVLISSFLFSTQAFGDGKGRQAPPAFRISFEQMERVKACKRLMDGADGKSLEQTVMDLERTPYIEENLLILEAVAKTYSEIILKYEVASKRKKEWLHSMVMLNMAYLQLGGGEQDGTSALNTLISRKLVGYLPPDLFKNTEIFQSLM